MMKKETMKIRAVAALVSGILSSNAYGADTNSLEVSGAQEVRLCTQADLVGTFTLEDLKETPPGEETKWFQQYPYHYLFFAPGSTYGYVASKHPFATEEDLQKKAKEETVGLEHTVERKYTLDNTGLLNLSVDDRLDYSYRCVFVLKQKGKAKPGDLEFLGYSKAQAALDKIYTRKQFSSTPASAPTTAPLQ